VSRVSIPKIVVDSDVLGDHLIGVQQPSILREVMGKFFCYTTVFQAIELFSLARTEKEKHAVEDSMAAMKILGLNAKNAGLYGTLMSSNRTRERFAVLIAGLCVESKLPLLTDRKRMYKGVAGLQCVSTRLVRRYTTGEEILRAARGKSKE